MASSLLLRGILYANKLIRSHYVDWLRNLKIVFTQKKISYVLNPPAPDTIEENASEEERTTYKI